ncbi:MAG: 4'-phosphopantetheinyl transferase superfamily protein [Pseudomonadota bacterium]
MRRGTIAISELTSDLAAAWIERNSPAGTAVAAGPIDNTEPFDDTEAAAMTRAVKKRRNEFHTGRRLSRVALAKLGCAATAIPADEHRVPVWPPGFVGTISHSRNLCIAHVGLTHDLVGVGVDVELRKSLPADVASRICRADESPGRSGEAALLHFVAKEAFYKAYFPSARTFLEYHDVRIEPDETRGTFRASLMANNKPALAGRRSFKGRIAPLDDHIAAALWITR